MISIVFITANRCQLLLEALATVTELTDTEPYEVIVVDNGSADNTVSQVREIFPEVRLLVMAENHGVAGGRNIGAAKAQGDIVIFIDDDALLESVDILDHLRRRFETNSRLAVVAFKIVNDQAGAVLSHEFPMRDHTEENIEKEQPVSYFVGCGFAVRRDFFLRTGGFFEEMVYGLEELDLSYRLLERGYDLLYCPKFVVRHRTPPAVRRKGEWYYNLMRSRVMLALRNLPWWAAAPHLLLWHGGMFFLALKHNHLKDYWGGVVAGWRMAPMALRTRQPIGTGTAHKLRALSGRLFY